MARTRRNGDQKPYKWLGHIQHHFNDQKRDDCIAWLEGRKPELSRSLDAIVQKEVGIKLSYSVANDGYHVTLQPKTKGGYYYGYTIGLEHADLDRLILIALYVVTELMEHEAIAKPDTGKASDW